MDDIEPTNHRDVPIEHLVQSKPSTSNGTLWFHDLDASLLPHHIDLMIVHHRGESLDAAAVLDHTELLQRTRQVLIVSDDGEAS